jgi:hypothetical protein
MKINKSYKVVDQNLKLKMDLNYGYISENIIDKSLILLNHYPLQSYNFFKTVKMTRGSANNEKHDLVRDDIYFNNFNKNNIDDFKLANRFIE